MQLKEYQQNALETLRGYLQLLEDWRNKAFDNPDLEIDFPAKAWEKAGLRVVYQPCRSGLGQPLPSFCLKVPTGGGKTLLAVKSIDLVNMLYRKARTGLVLWIVPTTQIYSQTIQNLKDRDHPYRQHLDIASGGRTLILEKTDRFTPLDIKENLVVMMLMLPAANRANKEVLKVFRDSGGFRDFFPGEDDIKAHEALLKVFKNLDTFESSGGFWGSQIKTSLGNTLRMLAPLIILDESGKAYSEGAQQTLRGFNPCMIVELSATPARQSNILADISGRELHREEMIKLDLHVVNKVSPDWKDTLLAGVEKRGALEEKAREHEANTGIYIRPICLIQVERTGKDQLGSGKIHSELVRDHLIKTVGVDPAQIAVKTSEKDELKEVDDAGGLLSRECPIRYIITKQALQEGWDCSFAYVLVILTNPSSENALTQLVGRILRQPFARKTRVKELDESYVFCFQQRGQKLLDDIKSGFEHEGLGDLKTHISAVSEAEGKPGGEQEKLFEIRERFRLAAGKTILPVFVVRDANGWRPVDYEMDIVSRIDWDQVDLKPVMQLALSGYEKKDAEKIITITDDSRVLLEMRDEIELEDSGIKVDPVFMTRQICDIVPNPWQAHEFTKKVLRHFRNGAENKEDIEKQLAANFVFLIEEMRKLLGGEKERLSEAVFRTLMANGELRFMIIGDSLDWSFPETISVKPALRTLTREDGTALQLSLFEFVPEEDFNETEKAVAWYLETQEKLFFWYRNRSRRDYSIQAWRHHRIYPDFIFTAADRETNIDYDNVYVVETKGVHLKGYEKTDYIRKVFDICTEQARLQNLNDVGKNMKGKVIRFDVLAEDEWKAKLNELFQQR